MSNAFYSDFDFQVCSEHGKRPDDYRTPFQVDRDRVIYSSAFRQLQSKTQVFLSGEYDFYRTRLTHSLEVAQIGRSICRYMRSYAETPLNDGFHVDADLVEAVCLSHDLGHPPFGHAGERTLHALMRGNGGFEGNAQTLRLLTSIIYLNENSGARGMAPTRAFLDGVLKYKTLLGENPGAENHFIYDDQAQFRQFVFDSTSLPDGLTQGGTLNTFRSIECQIMDWADDTAYSLNDIIDGVRAGFLAFEKMDRWADGREIDSESFAWMAELKRAITRDTLEAVFSKKIGECIRACRLIPCENSLSKKTNRYAFQLQVDADMRRQVAFYKRLAHDLIFASPQLAQLEYNGAVTLSRIFTTLVENYVNGPAEPLALVPAPTGNLITTESSGTGKTRRICDYLAGLTDGAARRTWNRLFNPDFASIKDLG